MFLPHGQHPPGWHWHGAVQRLQGWPRLLSETTVRAICLLPSCTGLLIALKCLYPESGVIRSAHIRLLAFIMSSSDFPRRSSSVLIISASWLPCPWLDGKDLFLLFLAFINVGVVVVIVAATLAVMNASFYGSFLSCPFFIFCMYQCNNTPKRL